MTKLSLKETIVESINNPIPKGTRKPLTAKAPKYEDPVHIQGFGVMERRHAEKHFPDARYVEYKTQKEEVEIVQEDAFSAWKRRMEKTAHDRGLLLLYKTEGATHGSTPEIVHAHLAVKMNGRTSPLEKPISSFSNVSGREIREEVENIEEIAGAGMKIKDLKKHMERIGWYLDRSNGPHDIYKHKKSMEHISIPRHSSEQSAVLMMKLKKKAETVLSESYAGMTINQAHQKALESSAKEPNKKFHIARHPNSYGYKIDHDFDEKHTLASYHGGKQVGGWKNLSEGSQHDAISMSVPLFIRAMEWAREDAKDDIEIHKFAENAVARSDVTLDSTNFEDLLP